MANRLPLLDFLFSESRPGLRPARDSDAAFSRRVL